MWLHSGTLSLLKSRIQGKGEVAAPSAEQRELMVY